MTQYSYIRYGIKTDASENYVAKLPENIRSVVESSNLLKMHPVIRRDVSERFYNNKTKDVEVAKRVVKQTEYDIRVGASDY
jgi:hypothetical protein